MIFTDIKQAVGSTLLDVNTNFEFSQEKPIPIYYIWTIIIFNTGILIKQWSHYPYAQFSVGPEVEHIDEINEYMPEELKELIKQYQ